MNEPNCGFYELTEGRIYCCYKHCTCDNYKNCKFHIHRVGEEDLKGSLIGIDGGGYPIYSE